MPSGLQGGRRPSRAGEERLLQTPVSRSVIYLRITEFRPELDLGHHPLQLPQFAESTIQNPQLFEEDSELTPKSLQHLEITEPTSPEGRVNFSRPMCFGWWNLKTLWVDGCIRRNKKPILFKR